MGKLCVCLPACMHVYASMHMHINIRVPAWSLRCVHLSTCVHLIILMFPLLLSVGEGRCSVTVPSDLPAGSHSAPFFPWA